MTGELFRYQVIVPLLYEPYDVHSVDPDSEAVFVLDASVSMSWVRHTEQRSRYLVERKCSGL